MELDFLTEDENSLFEHFATKLFDNRSEWYLNFHGTPWSIESDAVVYIDEDGCDTASFGWGAEYLLNEHLTKEEIVHMSEVGFIAKDKKIFAFSRFLMEEFIKATVLLKGADVKIATVTNNLKILTDGLDEIAKDYPLEDEEDDLKKLEDNSK